MYVLKKIVRWQWVLFVATFFYGCENKTIPVPVFASAMQIDSVIQTISNSQNAAESINAFKVIQKQNASDLVLQAKINLQLFLADSIGGKKDYEYLKNNIALEEKICKTTYGKKILALSARNLIQYYHKNSDFKGLLHNCEKYFKYTDTAIDSLYKSIMLVCLGNTYERLGDNKKAFVAIKQAVTYATNLKNDSQILDAYLALSNNLLNASKIEEAKTALQQALLLKNISQNEKDFLRFQILNFSDMDAFQKEKKLHNLIEFTKNEVVQFYGRVQLCELHLEKKDYASAIKYTEQAIQTPKQETRMIAKRFLQLGEIFNTLHQTDSAIYYLGQGLQLVTPCKKNGQIMEPILDSLKVENTIFDLCFTQATILMQNNMENTKYVQLAITQLLCAKKVAELLRAELLFDESKFNYGVDLKLVSEKLLQCYFALYNKTKQAQYAKQAFIIAEENKATALQDNTEANILASQTADTNYAKYISLRKQINDIEIKQSKAKDALEKEKLQTVYDGLVMQLGIYKSISKQVQEGKQKEITYEQMRQYLIKNKYNALSYFVGKENIFVLFLNAQQNKIQFDSCDVHLQDSVQALCDLQNQENVFSSQKNRFMRLSNTVYRNLFQNRLEQKNKNTIIILPDAVLNNLAFDALLTDSNQMNSFLVQQQKLSYAYSIRGLMSQQLRPFNTNKKILTMAPFGSNAIRNLPALQSSKTESNAIQKHYKLNLYADAQATFSNFVKNVERTQCIHIASHASAGEVPRLEFYDSSVHVNSLYQIPMQQSLAYLNTCQSGSGINYYSEGNLSLGRAFYSNGVHNIVLTLWNMNDASTATISNLFYKNLRNNNNSITALHEAKLNYLATQPLDKQTPYYWASLQHVGDGIMQIDTGIKKYWKFLLAGIYGILALVFLWFQKGKNV